MSPSRPKNDPPSAHPRRNAAWMYALFSFTPGSALVAAPMSCITTGVATSVYRCMSRPSNSHPSHAAVPDFHCCGDSSLSRVASAGAAGGAAVAADGVGVDVVGTRQSCAAHRLPQDGTQRNHHCCHDMVA